MTIPSYERRSFSETAVETTLATGISDSDTSVVIADATGWPSGSSGDFYIRIESEDIRVDTRTSTTLSVLTGGRGANGTSAASHSAGVAVTLVFTSFDADEANYAVSQTVGKVTAQGDLLVGSSSGVLARLAKGTSGLPLVAGASTLSYTTLDSTALATDSVTATQIAALAVGTGELAANAVTTTKITDANVTAAKLAPSAITQANFASGILPTAVATSAPTGVTGQLWFDSDDALLYVYNGTAWVCITPQSAVVATSQTTTSTSYTDLATSGPAVTVTTGTKALVTVGGGLGANTAGEYPSMSFAVSGASTVAASDTTRLQVSEPFNGDGMNLSRTAYVTGLTAGANTFTAKYKSGSGTTVTFANRNITVVGIP